MNKVMLMGYIGVTPEERSGVVSLRLATNERGYTKADGTEVPERTEWHNITIFEKKIAEFVRKHVKIGSLIQVEGKIHYSSYTDKEGTQRQGVEIIASSVSFPYFGQSKKGRTEQVGEQVNAEEDLPF